MSIISLELALALIGLIFWSAAYLSLGFIVLLAISNNDRIDRLTRRWSSSQVQLATALWPFTTAWLLWRLR